MAYRRLFVFLDLDASSAGAAEPTALARAVELLREEGGHIHVFATLHSGDRDSALADTRRKLDDLLPPFHQPNIQFDTEVQWTGNPQQAAVQACSRLGADLLVKGASQGEGNHYLLRHSPAPVLLCRRSSTTPYRRVLAALALEDNDRKHEAINNTVIATAQRVSRGANAALHTVSALEGAPNVAQILKIIEDEDEEKLSGEERISRSFGIQRDCVHIDYGPAKTVIIETADKLGADLLVIGTVARSGLSGAIVGNTCERVLAALPIDVLTVS